MLLIFDGMRIICHESYFGNNEVTTFCKLFDDIRIKVLG
jgi:hypothetical protein